VILIAAASLALFLLGWRAVARLLDFGAVKSEERCR
jgi:hypothetical protein